MQENNYSPPALQPNAVYHVFSHAVENNNLFYDTGNYSYFLKKWAHFSKDYFRTYAFCLMPNHFHLCFQTLATDEARIVADMPRLVAQAKQAQPDTLPLYHSKRMNSFLSSYVQSFNKYRRRKGTLFRSQFGRIQIKDSDYFKDLICYIHHNPIHHFDATGYHEWAYSSFESYRRLNEWAFLDTEIALNRFGSTKSLLDYHEKYRLKKRFNVIEEIVERYYEKYL
jgi:putative transposase